MSRYLGIIFVFSLIFLYACGGGGTNIAPTLGVSEGDADSGITESKPSFSLIANRLSRNSSYLPDKIQVKTPLESEELFSLATRYGLEVASKIGNWATLTVPDGDLFGAIESIAREQTVYDASIINTYTSSPLETELHVRRDLDLRMPNFLPTEPTFGDTYVDAVWVTGDPPVPFESFGQKIGWDPVSGQGGLDTGLTGDGVVLAIIDGGIYVDPDSTGGTIEDTLIHYELSDPDGLGGLVNIRLSPASAGYDGAAWTTVIDDPNAISYIESDGFIYRQDGNMALGLAAANTSVPINVNTPEEPMIVGMAGIAPGVTFMVLKIGTPNLDPEFPEYTFTDEEITVAVNYAFAAGADIIALGMFADTGGMFNGALVSAISDARLGDVLILAPTGENFDQEGEFWDDIEQRYLYSQNVGTDLFSPAAIDGVISVGSLGFVTDPLRNRYDFGPPNDQPPGQMMGSTANGADVYATGVGYTLFEINFADAGAPPDWFPYLTPGNFSGNQMALGYVMGASALGYEGIFNGGDPIDIDDQIAALLLRGGIEGTDFERILNVTYVASIAANGGYDLVYSALDVGATLPTSSNAVETNMEFSLEPVITNGVPPYEILIDWGDGTTYPESGDYEAWAPGTIYEKVGGYTEPGIFGLTIYARDDDGSIASGVANLLVTNPLGADPSVHETPDGPAITGALPDDPIPLFIGTDYFFHANPFNLLATDPASYAWDFDDGSPVDDVENPIHQFGSTGSYLITLTIDDGIRPIFEVEFEIDVS